MVLEPGEKVHVITRRSFEQDIRRHFVGEVSRATESTALVVGYVFVLNTNRNEFVRRPERRTRVVSLVDAGNVINVIPPEVELKSIRYQATKEDLRLVVTDGGSFQLDIHEFGGHR